MVGTRHVIRAGKRRGRGLPCEVITARQRAAAVGILGAVDSSLLINLPYVLHPRASPGLGAVDLPRVVLGAAEEAMRSTRGLVRGAW